MSNNHPNNQIVDSRCIVDLNCDEFRELDLSNMGGKSEQQANRLYYWLFSWRGKFYCTTYFCFYWICYNYFWNVVSNISKVYNSNV